MIASVLVLWEPWDILQGFCNLLLKFVMRHGTFNFLDEVVAGTLSLGFSLASKDDIYFLVQELMLSCVQDLKYIGILDVTEFCFSCLFALTQ